ncbi:class I SAM-dependent methyltransferase [Parasphingopyxis algicola]|uniref:class I SAM-dependent methyltransferase n=1 Tax=Parasphingopyxis algicola TaxID=2026624 RepID=UPI0015A3C39A|nr:class I SAM-dependent methyltransferase [Parasphingopyxis algicola]QLC26646.1 class I SAM-dependent methyltransferase [Parasphingopyxis algicola]
MSKCSPPPPSGFTVDVDLIGSRYAHTDAGPVLALTGRQLEARAAFVGKLAEGEYSMVWQACVVCAGTQFVIIAERDRYDLPVQTCICRECGLVQLNPRLRPNDYKDFYATLYRDLYVGRTLDLREFFRKQQRIGARIRRYLGDDVHWGPGTRILEVGTGAGGTLEYLCRDGAIGLGLDLDASYLEYGRQRWLNLRLETIDHLKLSFRPDLVIYRHVLEHLDNPIEELRKIAAICRRGTGMLYVEVPGVDSMSTAPTHVGGDLLKTLQNAHNFYFSRKSLANVLTMSGFGIRRIDDSVRSFSTKRQESISPQFKEDWRDIISRLRAIEASHLKVMSQSEN